MAYGGMTEHTESGEDQDRALIAAVARGDSDALERLYTRHGLALLNLLLGYLHDRQWAEDVLQTVMLAVWQGAAAFRGESQVRTWLFAIARRQALKALRQHTDTHQLLEETLPASDDFLHRHQQSSDLTTALGQLPHEQRIALELVFYRGLTLAEAAEYLDIPLNTLKSRLFRARNTLRVLLQEET